MVTRLQALRRHQAREVEMVFGKLQRLIPHLLTQYHPSMPKPTTEPKLWKSIAAMLEELDAPSLRGLVHDLFKLTPENRAFLAAWIGDEDASADAACPACSGR